MANHVKIIEGLLPILPEKDFYLAQKFLSNRDFESILELVRSNLYKSKKKMNGDSDILSEYEGKLIELEGELVLYMSFLEPDMDNLDEVDY